MFTRVPFFEKLEYMASMNIVDTIRQELLKNSTAKHRASNQKFFKENIVVYGVRTPIVRKIAKKYFKQIRNLDTKQIFSLSEELLKNKYNEEATVAIQWISALIDRFKKEDFKVFEGWLFTYIDNWSKDDDFCLHIIYPLIKKYPELISTVKGWAHAKNIWVQRASAVSFITTSNSLYATRHNLKDIFEVVDTLLCSGEDLVQKGCGWLLKAASIHNQKEVFSFVMARKNNMPRTTLRYAIEKMPVQLKKRAMVKRS